MYGVDMLSTGLETLFPGTRRFQMSTSVTVHLVRTTQFVRTSSANTGVHVFAGIPANTARQVIIIIIS